MPKVLVLTAGFGDGHNSAARGVAEALEGKAECSVRDLFEESMPLAFKYCRKGYLWTISNAPSLWRVLYRYTDRLDMSSQSMFGLGAAKKKLASVLNEWQPDCVVSTYMVMPYLLDRLFDEGYRRVPSLTVVTDSLVINKSWLCSRTDRFAVTDSWTKEVMEARGVDGSRIFVSGFPVSSCIVSQSGRSPISWDGVSPFKVLFFPQGRVASCRAMLTALLDAGPMVQVTCVMGRHLRRYFNHFMESKRQYGARIRLIGWTSRVPSLMASHHLVTGKAGGATTHECIAMARPLIVNFKTPGQEEGNLELLEKLGGGFFAGTPDELAASVRELLTDKGRKWKDMHENLNKANMRGGGATVADWCLHAINQ